VAQSLNSDFESDEQYPRDMQRISMRISLHVISTYSVSTLITKPGIASKSRKFDRSHSGEIRRFSQCSDILNFSQNLCHISSDSCPKFSIRLIPHSNEHHIILGHFSPELVAQQNHRISFK
jgi:hypothetical protein